MHIIRLKVLDSIIWVVSPALSPQNNRSTFLELSSQELIIFSEYEKHKDYILFLEKSILESH